jgi:hypothetical protein
MKHFIFKLFILCLLLTACGSGLDPFTGLEQAEREAEFYASQLTATADVRMFAITETAAAFNMMQTQTSYPYTVTALAYTATPIPTATPNAAATLVMANAQAQSTQMANQVQLSNLEVERARTTNTLRAMAAYVVGFIILLGAMMFIIAGTKRLSVISTPTNDQGKPLPMLDVVEGSLVDIDRSPNGVMSLKASYLHQLPAVTAERQDTVTNRAQLVDMKTRTKVTTAAVTKLLESQTGVRSALEAGSESASILESGLFPLPAWDILQSWNAEKNSLPYGITSRGLGLVNVDQFPHLATIGKTGEGKSRRFFRPLIACALAAGHRVLVIGKTTDYFVFDGHPNMTLAKINQMTEPRHAEHYAAMLKALVQEMNRRDDYLTSVHRSTWTHAGRERTFIFLDELGNSMRLMPSNLAEQVRIWAEGLVSEGRKVGFNVSVANQRATGMAGILSQTGKAIFRVERDEEKAHKSLSGASELHEGYFYARFGDVQLAGAFEPTDDDIRNFLNQRQTSPLDADWIDGQAVTSFNTALPASPTMDELPDENISSQEREQVTKLLEAGNSPSRIVWELWKVSGGGKFLRLNEEVKKIKDGLLEGVTA